MEITSHEFQGKCWLLLSAGNDRQHGGNDGYDDDPATYYSWDDTVANHSRISVGDVVALWDKRILLGISVIEAIDIVPSSKRVYRCPSTSCGNAKIKPRKTKSPLYRCHSCSSEFEHPRVITKEIDSYRSRHDAGWTDLTGLLSGAELRSQCESPRSQHSIRALRRDTFLGRIAELTSSDDRLVTFSSRVSVQSGHRVTTVRARRGQAAFRHRLLDRFGATCAISGSQPECVLDAAHLYRYAELGVHHDHGGLLLRKDIHALFDRGYIAVNPVDLLVDVSHALPDDCEYHRFHKRALSGPVPPKTREWLSEHWAVHRNRP